MAASCALRSGVNGPLEVITGAQIRQARELLGWPPTRLAQRAKVHSAIVRRAESVEGEPALERSVSSSLTATSPGEAEGEGAEGQVITGARILAARKLLCWPRDRLAPKAGIGRTMLKRIEEGAYVPSIEQRSALRAALEDWWRGVHEWRHAGSEAESQGSENHVIRGRGGMTSWALLVAGIVIAIAAFAWLV